MDPTAISVGSKHSLALCPNLDRASCFQWTVPGRKNAPILFGSVHRDAMLDIDGINRTFFGEMTWSLESSRRMRAILQLGELWADEAWFTVETSGYTHGNENSGLIEWYNLKMLAVRARLRSVVTISDWPRAEL
jgi:hypothetical protein